MRRVYLLYCDRHEDYGYFTRWDIGWNCGLRQDAKEFRTRAAAVKVLHRSGQHRYGVRVIVEHLPEKENT